MKPPLDDLDQIAKDSFASSILGGAAMVARILVSREPLSVGWIVRRSASAMITAAFVGVIAQDYIQSKGALYAAIGAAGAAAPELIDFVIEYVRSRGAKEVSNVKKTKKGR